MNRRGQDRTGPLGGSGMVGLWGASSLIRSVQYGSVNFVASNAPTATINAVDLNNAVLYRIGTHSNGSTVNPSYAIIFSTLTLTNATTVTGNLNVGSYGITNVESFVVVEYQPGLIKSIQTGSVAKVGTGFPNVVSGTATITRVDPAKTLLVHRGTLSSSPGTGAGFADYDSAGMSLTLTDGVTVTGTCCYTTDTLTGRFTAVEFF